MFHSAEAPSAGTVPGKGLVQRAQHDVGHEMGRGRVRTDTGAGRRAARIEAFGRG